MTDKKTEKKQQIFVERDTYEKNDKTYFSYFIKGVIRGREVRIGIAPPNSDTDIGGYTVLDLVFGNADKAELVLVPYEIKDEKTKKVVKGNSYAIRTVDAETGEVYECAVKPFRTSDKALLNMLLNKTA